MRLPAVEPSLGFDTRLHARIAEEPRTRWFGWLTFQPRLAFAMAMLLALSVWMGNMPRANNGGESVTAATEQEEFETIKDLGVLENYDVLSKFDALSEVPAEPSPANQQAQPVNQQNPDQQPPTQE